MGVGTDLSGGQIGRCASEFSRSPTQNFSYPCDSKRSRCPEFRFHPSVHAMSGVEGGKIRPMTNRRNEAFDRLSHRSVKTVPKLRSALHSRTAVYQTNLIPFPNTSSQSGACGGPARFPGFSFFLALAKCLCFSESQRQRDEMPEAAVRPPRTTQHDWLQLSISLQLIEKLVGAGRFERPTPCAQDGFRLSAEIACFQSLHFKRITVGMLKLADSD